MNHCREGRASTDSRHRTSATGIVEDSHGPPLLVRVVVLLDPFDADQVPPRFNPPGYLSDGPFVLRIVVCCFVAKGLPWSAFAHGTDLDHPAPAHYFLRGIGTPAL